jgi:ubiquitin carboxyl-terminal hydrolase 36/42
MGETSAAAEGLMHRRIEFHAATNPGAAPAVVGGFPMQRFFADAGKRVTMPAGRSEEEGRRFEKGASSGSGFDSELSAARIYQRRIVSVLFLICIAIFRLLPVLNLEI